MTSLTLRQESPLINLTILTGGQVVFSLRQGDTEIASLSYRRVGSEAIATYGSTAYRFFVQSKGAGVEVVVSENDAEIGRVTDNDAWQFAGPKTFSLSDGSNYLWKANFFYTRCTWYSSANVMVVSVSPRGQRVDVSDGVEINARTVLLILLAKFLALNSVPRNPMTLS